MSIELVTVLLFVCVLGLILLGYPIGLVLAGVATIFGLIFLGPQIFDVFTLRIFGIFSDYVLVAVPLFVFMGIVIEKSGIAMRLFDAMYVLLGRLRGGLAVATVVTCTIFATVTGVVGASVVTMGILALPAMLKYKYDKALATGSICASATLAILIPPSIMLVVYGPIANVSVGVLFAGAFLPGFLLALLYIAYILVRCHLDPAAGPTPDRTSEPFTLPAREKLRLFAVSVAPVVLLILAVLGTIFFGLAAPTEAAALGAFFGCLLAAAYRKLNLQVLREAALQTLRVTAMVYLLLIGAGFFTGVFMRLGCGSVVKELLLGFPLGGWGALLLMWFIIFLLGFFIDWIAVVLITVPIFTPVATALGFDPVWFAMMNIIVLQTSFLTPPFAFAIFMLQGVAPPEVKTGDIYRGVVPFVALQACGILLCVLFPEIILFLPRLLGLI